MTTPTLEQELEDLVRDQDYRLHIYAGDKYLGIELIYLPKLVVKGEGAFAYMANGRIAKNHWAGRRRWKKAKKWVVKEIEGHRALIRTVQQA
jgi:hypothetical protein